MENDNGHIVNIASVLGYIGCCGISDYCASKSALVIIKNKKKIIICLAII